MTRYQVVVRSLFYDDEKHEFEAQVHFISDQPSIDATKHTVCRGATHQEAVAKAIETLTRKHES